MVKYNSCGVIVFSAVIKKVLFYSYFMDNYNVPIVMYIPRSNVVNTLNSLYCVRYVGGLIFWHIFGTRVLNNTHL